MIAVLSPLRGFYRTVNDVCIFIETVNYFYHVIGMTKILLKFFIFVAFNGTIVGYAAFVNGRTAWNAR